MYIVDVKPLQAWTQREAGQMLMLYEPGKVRWSAKWGEKPNSYAPVREPKLVLRYFVDGPEGQTQELTVRVADGEGKVLHSESATVKAGMNAWRWNLDMDPSDGYDFLKPGTYNLEVQLNFERRSVPLIVKKPGK